MPHEDDYSNAPALARPLELLVPPLAQHGGAVAERLAAGFGPEVPEHGAPHLLGHWHGRHAEEERERQHLGYHHPQRVEAAAAQAEDAELAAHRARPTRFTQSRAPKARRMHRDDCHLGLRAYEHISDTRKESEST